MTGDRGASRWTVAALLAVVIGVVVSVGVAQGWFDGDGDAAGPESEATDTTDLPAEASAPSSTQTPTTTAAAVATTAQPTAVGDHPLCGLHEELVVAIEGNLPVEGPEELEAFITAQIDFHQDAVDVLDQPEREGFAGMLTWYEALAVYYEPLEWNPSPGLEVLADNPPPQPSPEAVSAASRTLEELCGIVPGEDQPAP